MITRDIVNLKRDTGFEPTIDFYYGIRMFVGGKRRYNHFCGYRTVVVA